jgi:hypothetical protein
MTQAALRKVQALLGQLSDAEIQGLILQLKARGQFAVETPVLARDEEDWLLRGIVKFLRKRGLVSTEYWPGRELRKKIAAHYDNKAVEVRKCMAEHLHEPSRATLGLLGTLAAEALAAWLVKHDQAITIQSMLHNVSRVMDAFDDSYPGYLECGLLEALLNHAQSTPA